MNSEDKLDRSMVRRTSRSLQYDQHHTQYSDPVYQHIDPHDPTSPSWEGSPIAGNESSFGFGAVAEFETAAAAADSTAVNDSLIVICTLFVPLAIAISAILIIALLIRRMRRAESLRDMDDEEKCTGTQPPPPNACYSQEISTEDIPHSVVIHGQQNSQEFISPSFFLNNKKSIPLPVILGLVEPDDDDPTTTSKHSCVATQCEEPRRASPASLVTWIGNGGHRLATDPIPCNISNYQNNVVESYKSSSSAQQLNSNSSNSLNCPDGNVAVASPPKSTFGNRVASALQFPKRIKEQQAEKKRFNIYTISVETREQLKQIYVY